MENTDNLENRFSFGTLTSDGFPCLSRALTGKHPRVGIQNSDERNPVTQLCWAGAGGKLFGRTRIGPVDWATICQSGLNNGREIVVDNMRFIFRIPDIKDGYAVWPSQWKDEFWGTGKDAKRGTIRRFCRTVPPYLDLVWSSETDDVAEHLLVLVLEPVLPDLSILVGEQVTILTPLGKGTARLKETSDYDIMLDGWTGTLDNSWGKAVVSRSILRRDAVLNIGKC